MYQLSLTTVTRGDQFNNQDWLYTDMRKCIEIYEATHSVAKKGN